MARAAFFEDHDDEDDVDSPFDDFDDDDEGDEDIDEDDTEEEARAFYDEHAAPLTVEDTVAILAAAAGEAFAVCRECGCSNNRACPGGCFWVAPDLCSRCA